VRPPSAPYARTPPQPLGSHSLSGNPPLTPFTAPSMPPPATFPGAPHGRPAVSGLPYGPPSAQVCRDTVMVYILAM
jgi:protein transport protein SEC24